MLEQKYLKHPDEYLFSILYTSIPICTQYNDRYTYLQIYYQSSYKINSSPPCESMVSSHIGIFAKILALLQVNFCVFMTPCSPAAFSMLPCLGGNDGGMWRLVTIKCSNFNNYFFDVGCWECFLILQTGSKSC